MNFSEKTLYKVYIFHSIRNIVDLPDVGAGEAQHSCHAVDSPRTSGGHPPRL